MALLKRLPQPVHKFLCDGLVALGLGTDALTQLAMYVAELDRWNRVYRFVKADQEQLVSNHVLDALTATKLVRTLGRKIGDFGSGVGLPAIPLAITLPDLTFTLIERSEKRRAFLAAVVPELELRNVRVCADAAGQHFDLLTARAVAPLPDLAAVAARQRLSRRLLVYAGKRTTIDSALPRLPYPAIVRRVQVPQMTAERHLVTIDLGQSILPSVRG